MAGGRVTVFWPSSGCRQEHWQNISVAASGTYPFCIHPVNLGDVGLAMAANSDHGEGFLRSEDAAGFNPRETFLQGQELGNFPPLPGVAEIGKVEPINPRVLKSGKL